MESSSKPQQVVLSPPEVPSVWRNLKLITSPWNAFVYLIHPAFAYWVMSYTPLHLGKPSALDPYVPFMVRLVVGMLYLVFAYIFAMNRSSRIEEDLRRRGYEQRGSLQRLFIPLSGMVGLWWLNEHIGATSLANILGVELSLAVFCIVMWSMSLYTMLGTILLLTVRVD